MARRFNIGDKVIKFKPSYFNNTFHKNHYVEYGIVTDADDDRFTTQGTNMDGSLPIRESI